jgi:hypothetical protein
MPTHVSVGNRLTAILTSRKAGVAAGALILVIILGCMSIAIGNRSTEESSITPEGTLVQTGEAMVQDHDTETVYYPVPYISPPNLEISSSFDDCVVVEQAGDHFRVKNPSAFCRKVTWKARGLRVSVTPPPPPNADGGPALPELAPAPRLLPATEGQETR